MSFFSCFYLFRHNPPWPLALPWDTTGVTREPESPNLFRLAQSYPVTPTRVLIKLYGPSAPPPLPPSPSKSKCIKNKAWLYLVLDEAHLLRNPATRIAKAARGLRSNHRVGLTGTPIQNSVVELWSLFQFLMPG